MGDPVELKSIETVEEWMDVGDSVKFKKDMLYIVEVYAEWCGESMAAKSTYKKIRDEYEMKKFKMCKVCASLGKDIAEAGGENVLEPYEILARPTFLLFKDGEQIAKVEGVSMPTLEKLVKEHMPEGFMEEEVVADDDEGGDD